MNGFDDWCWKNKDIVQSTLDDFVRDVDDMDDFSNPLLESKKLVKEGAGAGYTVKIKDLKFGKILSKKLVPDKYYGYYECQVEILPGEYEIAAEDYYNDFFWQEHEFGDTPTAKIDGGVATVVYSKQWEDDEQAEEDLIANVEDAELNISFDYGWGWTHVDLPREKIEADHVNVENDGYYAGIDKIELNAPDLADAVNSGHKSIDDMEDEQAEEDDGEEEYDESTKKVVKESSEDFERFFETLKFKFRKDGCNVNLRDNEDGTEVIEIDAPTDVDGKLFDFIKRKCESNHWFFERECGRLLTTYSIWEDENEDEEPINESVVDEDGWRVFDYGEDFPYTERYTVLDHDGYQFFISHNGGVGAFTEDAIDEIDSDKISDILELEIDGKTYRPRELDSDEISSNRIVQKGLKHIKVKFQYEKEDDLVTESYDDEWNSVGAAFDEFRQRLWKYTRKDRENRMEFYQDCMKKCEEGYKLYHDACVAEV